MQAGDRHMLLCHKMPCLRTLPEWAGGLHASEPSPCHPIFPRDLLFLLFFSLWHFPTLPVPSPLHTVLHEGLGLPWPGLCAAAHPCHGHSQGTVSEKTYQSSLGECHALR